MRSLIYPVIVPVALFILGILVILLGEPYGVFLSGAGALWLVLGFLVHYGEDERQNIGMGKDNRR